MLVNAEGAEQIIFYMAYSIDYVYEYVLCSMCGGDCNRIVKLLDSSGGVRTMRIYAALLSIRNLFNLIQVI